MSATYQDTDFERSLRRQTDREYFRADSLGFGHTGQGRALVRQLLPQLAKQIAADRAKAHNKVVWKALRATPDEVLAERLLIGGISVCYSETIGTDIDGKKNFRDIALWLARNLRLDGRQVGLNLKVGAWGARLLRQLPIFTMQDDGILTLNLTDSVDEFLNEIVEIQVRHNALLSPMFSPPEPWTQFRKGGLPADHDWAQEPLVAENHPSIERAVCDAIAEGKVQRVLDALNYLQGTPFVINKPVLDFMLRAPRLEVPKPAAYEPWKKSNQEEWADWQKSHEAELDLATARTVALAGRFWQPLQLDFRGRVYPIPFFNFTRSDSIRGLFLFADGQVLDEGGLKWLKAHVAARSDGNTWSRDPKPSRLDLDGRVAWTEENHSLLSKVGNAVLNGDDPKSIWWLVPEDDEPWQFIAACTELTEAQAALAAGREFRTRLPLVFDACCSGLQHISAMTRSNEGRFVNLTPPAPGGAGSDFYGMAALALWKMLRICPRLEQLMKGPTDRKIVKRPIVSFFYGGTLSGMARAVRKEIKDRNDARRKRGRPRQELTQISGDVFSLYEVNGVTYGKFKGVRFKTYKDRGIEYGRFVGRSLSHMFVKILDRLVAEDAPAAVGVRKFLRDLARACARDNKPLRFTTPLGWPVIGAYYEPISKRFAVPAGSGRRYFNLIVGDNGKIDQRDAVDGIAANFVHAADACHLHMVALAAAKEAIPLVSVHDCFGTTAVHAARLNEIIREQFIRLHRHNLLNGVRQAARRDLPETAKLPDLPEVGDLDLEQIAKSFFAFN